MDEIERAFVKSEAYKKALSDYRLANEGFKWNEGELGDFLSELFVESRADSVKASRIHELHTEWASINEMPALSQKGLGMELRKNLQAKRMSDGIYYLGIKEKGFDRPTYRLYDKETGKTNGEYYDKAGLVKFAKEYWAYSNEGQEMPERLKNLRKKDVEKELNDFGFRAEAVADRFGFITQ